MLGDFLYQLRPIDQQVTPLEFIHFFDQKAVAGTTITTDGYKIPDDKILQLRTCVVRGVPTAAITVINLWAQVDHHNQIFIFSGRRQTQSGVGTQIFHEMQSGGLIIEPGGLVRGAVEFDGSNVGNVVSLYLMGYLIPRGNIAV